MAERIRVSTRSKMVKLKRLNDTRSHMNSVSHRKQTTPRRCECIVMEELIHDSHSPPEGSDASHLSTNRDGDDSVNNQQIDLTDDNDVVSDTVDLTTQSSPLPIRIPPISYFRQQPPLRSSCRYANSTFNCPPPLPTMPKSPDVVFLQATNEDVVVVNSHSHKRKKKKVDNISPVTKSEPSSPDINNKSRSSLSCPVCLQTVTQFEAKGQKLVTTICGHIFCSSCIRNSISTMHKCPTCRRKLTLNQYHQLYL